MSHLEKSGGPSGSKAIISVWIKVLKDSENVYNPWPKELIPKQISLNEGKEVVLSGGLYYGEYPQLVDPRIRGVSTEEWGNLSVWHDAASHLRRHEAEGHGC